MVNIYGVLIGLALAAVALVGLGLSVHGWLESSREAREERRGSGRSRRLW
jgi:hypothetical protein